MIKWAVMIVATALSGCGTMTAAPESDLRYQHVHEVDFTEQEIFNRAQEWLAMRFVDSTEVIEVANQDTSTIIGKGRTSISPTGLVGVPVRFTIKIEAKPGRYRTTYSDYTGYYGEYRNKPYAIQDAVSAGQMTTEIMALDGDLLKYLQSRGAKESW